MGAQLLSSKIVIVEEEPRIRSIPALPTAIVGAVGVAERGPIGAATLVNSWEEYVNTFGGFTADSDLATAAFGFFLNGGEQLWVVRTVHYSDIVAGTVDTAAKATQDLESAAGSPTQGSVTGTEVQPFVLAPGDVLDIDVDGVGSAPATFDAASATITSSNSETYALADGQTLTLKIDGGPVQTVTFNTGEFVAIGAATAQEVANVINAEATGLSADDNAGAVRITSDKKGLASNVEITGGTANTALGFSTTPVPGTGDVQDIAAVTVAEVKAVVEADITGGSGVTVNNVSGAVQIESNKPGGGPTSTIQVLASSTADTKMGLDNATHSGTDGSAVSTVTMDGKTEGAYANSIEIDIEDASSGVAAEFNLSVVRGGVVVEVFPNLTVADSAADNFIDTVVNDASTGSQLVTATDLSVGLRPANGTYGPMTGGNDGLTSLDDNDFIGNDASDTGLYALDTVQNLTLLIVPGQATSAVHNAMISYAEVHRGGSLFCVLDPPAAQTATQIVSYVETTAAILGLSEFGAIYWPQIKVLNPNKTVFGDVDQITVPPSGHIVGVYARTDNSRPGGVYQPPAGVERGLVFGCIGFETDEVLDEKKLDIVYPKRINPITVQTGTPRFIDGSRTLKGDGNFPYVAERRGVIFIEQSLRIGLLFAKHSNHTPELRARVRRTIFSFLKTQMDNDAFRSNDPTTAFFVDVSEALNPPSVVFAGQLIARVGLATNKPAEFIILKFSQDTRALEEELAA